MVEGDVITISKRTLWLAVTAYIFVAIVFAACLPLLERHACHWGDGMSADTFAYATQPLEHIIAGAARFQCDMLRGTRKEVVGPMYNVISGIGDIVRAMDHDPLRDNPFGKARRTLNNLREAAAISRRPEYD